MSQAKYERLNIITKRELEVLQGLVDCSGDYNAIAVKLCVSQTTVKTHSNNIFAKLGVNNKVAAVLEGLKRKLITLPFSTDEAGSESLGLNPAFLLL